MRITTFLAATFWCFTLASYSQGISGVDSSDPYVAEQARKAQQLQIQVDAQKQTVDTEKNKLKALETQLDGAKQNLKGRKQAGKV